MFDISSMRDCKLPDDKVAIVLEQINDLPRLYAVYVNWFGTDGKKNINGIKKPRLNKDRHMLANSLNTVTALIEKTENDFTDPEGYALPPSLVNAKCELIAARNEIERALHKYDRAIAYLGDGHIPIDLPWRLIAQELFNIIFNATNQDMAIN